MRQLIGALAAALGFAAAGAAVADPSVEIRNAVARVVVSPEARSDIAVEIIRSNPRLPLRVHKFGDRTFVEGDLGHRIRACGSFTGGVRVHVAGVGDIGYDQMPQLLIHTPMDARVFAGGAVFGAVGRSDNLDFANAGCGDWLLGNVRGRLRVSQAGSGDTKAGSAGQADLSVAGSGNIITREIRDGLTAVAAGSGDIHAASVDGPFVARVAGSGNVRASGGHVSRMQASIAGSGDISLLGVAQSLRASVVGSGDVSVTQVTGPVSKAMIGSGDVRIGP